MENKGLYLDLVCDHPVQGYDVSDRTASYKDVTWRFERMIELVSKPNTVDVVFNKDNSMIVHLLLPFHAPLAWTPGPP